MEVSEEKSPYRHIQGQATKMIRGTWIFVVPIKKNPVSEIEKQKSKSTSVNGFSVKTSAIELS